MIPEKSAGPTFALLVAVLVAGCTTSAADTSEEPHTTAASPVEAGRYIVSTAGCNDCHTVGYLFNEGNVPEAEWLLGNPVGWRGPWGTSYARNLRITVTTMTEDAWVEMLKTRRALPPMPWMTFDHMSETDMRAVYQYIRSLGPAGSQPPNPVPPGQEPATPYLLLEPVMPPTQ